MKVPAWTMHEDSAMSILGSTPTSRRLSRARFTSHMAGMSLKCSLCQLPAQGRAWQSPLPTPPHPSTQLNSTQRIPHCKLEIDIAIPESLLMSELEPATVASRVPGEGVNAAENTGLARGVRIDAGVPAARELAEPGARGG